MNHFCCDFSKSQLTFRCVQHGKDCPDIVLVTEQGEFYLEAANATYLARFCPSCGKELKIHCYEA